MNCLVKGCSGEAVDDGNYCAEHQWDMNLNGIVDDYYEDAGNIYRGGGPDKSKEAYEDSSETEEGA